MENVSVVDLVPAACTSLRCLAQDVKAAPDVTTASNALFKHDRHLYLLAVVTVLLLLVVWLGRRTRFADSRHAPYAYLAHHQAPHHPPLWHP